MKIRNIVYGVMISLALTSCSSKRDNLSYFQDINTATFTAPVNSEAYLPKIEPSDELNITVSSIRPELSAMYNLPLVNPAVNTNGTIQSSQISQSTYFVSPQGDINMPVLGKIHVAGMTEAQLAEKLTQIVSKDVEDPVVTVQLVNFKVNVGGEVVNPGTFNVRGKRISILDALAMAGDLTQFGNRERVILIREEDGKRVARELDLTKAETLTSPYFFLKQNDYVYVSPNEIRQENSKYNQNNAYKLSVISTIVSAASVIASLVIALTIK